MEGGGDTRGHRLARTSARRAGTCPLGAAPGPASPSRRSRATARGSRASGSSGCPARRAPARQTWTAGPHIIVGAPPNSGGDRANNGLQPPQPRPANGGGCGTAILGHAQAHAMRRAPGYARANAIAQHTQPVGEGAGGGLARTRPQWGGGGLARTRPQLGGGGLARTRPQWGGGGGGRAAGSHALAHKRLKLGRGRHVEGEGRPRGRAAPHATDRRREQVLPHLRARIRICIVTSVHAFRYAQSHPHERSDTHSHTRTSVRIRIVTSAHAFGHEEAAQAAYVKHISTSARSFCHATHVHTPLAHSNGDA